MSSQNSNTSPNTPPEANASRTIVVGIGASAGGLDALKKFFNNMSEKPNVAFVVVQHLDPTHESLMADLLGRCTTMPVLQVTDQTEIKNNSVYVIPPNRDLSLSDNTLILTHPLERRGLRMPIDFFLASLAEDLRERAIGVVLSGTGSDGTQGLRQIKENGGLVIAQSPETAQHSGMPTSAISTGTVDYILPPEEMPSALIKYIQHSYVQMNLRDDVNQTSEEHFNRILAVLNAQTQHDFSFYKKNTLHRRIIRRMGLHHIESFKNYTQFLRTNAEEVTALFQDLLISVTAFFRDPELWDTFRSEVLPDFMTRLTTESPLRVWVPGCASGEEAYTLGLLLLERLHRDNRGTEFQIFGTDIDEKALEIARAGIYPNSIAASISADYLNRYFIHQDDTYQVHRQLRDSIVFSHQNLINDPPFSRLHLISCRNLLIYLEPEIQRKVISLFHFALNPGGFLILGNSETIGSHQDLFEVVSKKWRIYRKIGVTQRHKVDFPIIPSLSTPKVNKPKTTSMNELPLSSIADLSRDVLLKAYAPASVLINRKYEILYFYGETENYLAQPSGEPTIDFLTLLREGLRNRVRGAIHRAMTSQEDVVISGIQVKRNNAFYPTRLIIKSLQNYGYTDGLLLVSFCDEITDNDPSAVDIAEHEEPIIKQLEYEIKATREDLQSTIEELETTNEELKASNEEVMSMNEELQSSNEELETAKEELQSLNEELSTVNHELQDKIEHVEKTNDDLSNLITSTEKATIFLNTRLEIKRFTPKATNIFRLIATDNGRSLLDVVPRFESGNLRKELETVLDTLISSETEIAINSGEIYLQRILPYRTQENHIEGLVVTYDNITELRKRDQDLRISEERLSLAIEAGNLGIYDHEVPIEQIYYYSERWAEIFGYTPSELPEPKEIVNWIFERVHPEDQEYLADQNEQFLNGKIENYHIEIRIKHRSGAWIHVEAKSKIQERDAQGHPKRIIGVLLDITKRKEQERELALLDQRFKEAFENETIERADLIERVDLAFQSTNGGGVWELELQSESPNEIPDDIYISPNLKAMIGFKDDELPNSVSAWFERIVTEDQLRTKQAAQEYLEKELPFYEVCYRIKHKNGSLRTILSRGKLITQSDHAKRWIGVDWDITDAVASLHINKRDS